MNFKLPNSQMVGSGVLKAIAGAGDDTVGTRLGLCALEYGVGSGVPCSGVKVVGPGDGEGEEVLDALDVGSRVFNIGFGENDGIEDGVLGEVGLFVRKLDVVGLFVRKLDVVGLFVRMLMYDASMWRSSNLSRDVCQQ